MATINRDYVSPAEITSQTRTALAELEVNSPNSFAEYLPSETIDDIEYEADAGQGGLIEAAMYRAYDAGLTVGRDETLGKMRGRIAPLGQKLLLLEEARLRLRNDSQAALTANIERKAKRIAEAIAIQVNIKRADALAFGKLTFEGNGQDFDVDFGRRPDFTNTAAELWSDPASDPIEHLGLMADLFEAENGFRPTKFLTSLAVKTAFYRHPKVTAMAVSSIGNLNRMASPAEVDALLSLYNLPGFTVKAGRVKTRKNDGSELVRFLIPQDSIIMLGDPGSAEVAGSSELGATYWGVTVEATRSNWGIEQAEWAGIVTAVFDNDGVPAVMSVEGSAIATPVLHNPNYSLKTKVL